LKGVYSGIPWPQGSGLLRAAVLRGACAHGGPPYTAVSTQMMHPMAPDGIARTISGSGRGAGPFRGPHQNARASEAEEGCRSSCTPSDRYSPWRPGGRCALATGTRCARGSWDRNSRSAFLLERFSALTYFPQPASCTKPYAGVLFRGVLNLLPNRV
jgi:hypothetical protein